MRLHPGFGVSFTRGRFFWLIAGLLLAFVVLRILLFNFNVAEWGDSYSIIRAAESLRTTFTYPIDEKRLPLFSALIALNPLPIPLMSWAKVLQGLLTFGVLFLTYRLARKILRNQNYLYAILASVLTALTPIFLYWSIRVVSEVLLTFLVLLTFDLFYSFVIFPSDRPSSPTVKAWQLVVLGFVSGLAAMSRYEGFFLVIAIAVGLIAGEARLSKGRLSLKRALEKAWPSILIFGSTVLLVSSPWLIRNFLLFGNPIHSSYFGEPATYDYNLKIFATFFSALAFLFGFPPAFYFVVGGVSRAVRSVRQDLGNLPLLVFVSLDLLLIFVWPAGVPRLFLPTIPIFMIWLVAGLSRVDFKDRRRLLFPLLGLTVAYPLVQLYVRLYPLVLSRAGMILICGTALFFVVLIWLFGRGRPIKAALISLMIISQLISAFVIIGNHRLLFSPTLQAAKFASSQGGLVGYSDETGVSAWYLGAAGRKLPDNFFMAEQQWDWLRSSNISYAVSTDEYEQMSKFNFFDDDRYRPNVVKLASWQITVSDMLDSWLMQKGIMPRHDYTTWKVAVYKIQQ